MDGMDGWGKVFTKDDKYKAKSIYSSFLAKAPGNIPLVGYAYIHKRKVFTFQPLKICCKTCENHDDKMFTKITTIQRTGREKCLFHVILSFYRTQEYLSERPC